VKLQLGALALCALGALVLVAAPAYARGNRDPKSAAKSADADDPLAKYFSALESMKLIDVESGTLETLKRELGTGEKLLTDGAFTNAAVALYAIVKSPRYASFTDFVEFQNAEYDLSVALARAGAYGASLDVIEAILKRGPAAPYWGPAHRRAVDIGIETRDHGLCRRRAQLSPWARRVRRRQAHRCPGRARVGLEEEPAVFLGSLSTRRDLGAQGRAQELGRGDVRDRGDRGQ